MSSKFIFGFYDDIAFSLITGEELRFKNSVVDGDTDSFVIYEGDTTETRIIFKSNIVQIILYPDDKKKAGATDGQA